MNKIKVTIVRRVEQTYTYILDADVLDIPSSDKNLSPAAFGDACDAIFDAINGPDYDKLVLDETLEESDIQEESVDGWSEDS